MTQPEETGGERVLHFRCGNRDVELALGRLFAAPVSNTYRDAPEADLLQLIAQIDSGRPWREAVADIYRSTNPWLFRIVTDRSRDLFFRLNPPRCGARILDIGSGWGQIGLPLASKGYVCAVEPGGERIGFQRAAARQEGLAEKMWFLQADFLEVEFADHFDLIACVGVLEWVGKFAPELHPLEAQRRFLSKIRAALAPGGKAVIGIENRLGLKYLMGAPDDHIGHPGIAVFDFALADQKWREFSGEPLRSVTHTRAGLEAMLRGAGFENIEFWAAFPDYKLPERITKLGSETEDFLKSGFIREHDGTRGGELVFQEELRSHYASLAELGIASNFVPSFYVVCHGG